MGISVTVTAPPIFRLPWRRDPNGYRVIRTVRELENLGERAAAGDDWPEQWPDPSWPGRWLENMLEDARRMAPAGVFPGEGLIWPCSEESEPCGPLHGEHGLAKAFLDGVGTTPDDGADVLAFVNNYGLLTEEAPTTVTEFRRLRYDLAWLIEGSEQFQDKTDAADKRHEYEGLARDEADKQSDYAPRFTIKLVPHPHSSKRGLTPQIVPEDLYSLVALEITHTFYDHSIQWRRCGECDGFFTAGTNGARGAKARYCSELCRTRHNEHNRASKSCPVIYAEHPCPYCGGAIRLSGRRAVEHCGATNCRRAHSRANQKARAASA